MVDEKRQSELIQQLAEIVAELEWVIALPTSDTVPGLIVGNEEFVADVIKVYYGLDEGEYATFTEDPTGETALVETPIDQNKKPKTYH